MDMNLNESILRTALFADQMAMARAAATRILDSFYLEGRIMPEAEYSRYAKALAIAPLLD